MTEEQILDALGSVKDRYVLEAGRFITDGYRMQKKHRFGGLGVAAALFLVLSSLFFVRLWQSPETVQGSDTDTSHFFEMRLSEDRMLKAVLETPVSEESYLPISRVLIYEGEHLIQQITASDIGDTGIYYSEGLFINEEHTIGLPDIRDVNFDGYCDFGLLAVSQYPRNVSYNYFLWNPEKDAFEFGFTAFGADALILDYEDQILKIIDNTTDSQVITEYRYEKGLMVPVDTADSSLPQFSIDYHPQKFQRRNEGSITYLTSLEDENCRVVIQFCPGLLPYAAAVAARAELNQSYPVFSDLSRDADSGYLWFTATDESNSMHVRFISAGQEGTFQITCIYPETMQKDIMEIAGSFDPLISDAERVVITFADAYFMNDRDTMKRYAPSGIRESIPQYSHPATFADSVYEKNGAQVSINTLRGIDDLDQSISGKGYGRVNLQFTDSSSDWLILDIIKENGYYCIRSYILDSEIGTAST